MTYRDDYEYIRTTMSFRTVALPVQALVMTLLGCVCAQLFAFVFMGILLSRIGRLTVEILLGVLETQSTARSG